MKLYLEATPDTPEIRFDKEDNFFRISGNSLPEEVAAFYAPIIRWLKEYSQEPNPKSFIEIKLSYFNSASSKMIFTIMEIWEKLKMKNADVSVKWYYEEDDEDMLESGKSMKESLHLPFEFIAYMPED